MSTVPGLVWPTATGLCASFSSQATGLSVPPSIATGLGVPPSIATGLGVPPSIATGLSV